MVTMAKYDKSIMLHYQQYCAIPHQAVGDVSRIGKFGMVFQVGLALHILFSELFHLTKNWLAQDVVEPDLPSSIGNHTLENHS